MYLYVCFVWRDEVCRVKINWDIRKTVNRICVVRLNEIWETAKEFSNETSE